MASTQVSSVQSLTTWRSRCHSSGSPATLPTMKPTTGQRTRQLIASSVVQPVL